MYRGSIVSSILALASCGALGALGCEEHAFDDVGEREANRDGEGWTIFVYGHADHSLSTSLVRDIQEMQNATLSLNINVVVLADFDGSHESFDSGTTWFRINGDGGEPEVIDVSSEQDLDDPQVLSAAVERAFTEYPARFYGIVMWDHGGAWEQGFGGDTHDGTRLGEGLTAAQIADALADGLDAAGVEGDPPLRFLAFDTCLMSSPEIIYEFYGLSRIFFANAELDYGDGWDYQTTLTWISDHPNADPRQLAEAEVLHWDAHHEHARVDDAMLRTHVALDMDGLDGFIDAIAELSSRWQTSDDLDDHDLGNAAFFAMPGYSNGLADVLGEPNLRDVGQFLDLLSVTTSDRGVADAATEAYLALDSMIVSYALGDLRAQAGQLAMHIELPAARDIESRLAAYRAGAEAWNIATDWAGALDNLSSRADAYPPTVVTDYGSSDASLRFRVNDRDVAMATAHLAMVDPLTDDVYELGVVGLGAVEPGETYEMEWDGAITVIGEVEVCVLPWNTPGTDLDGVLLPPVFAAPGVLRHAEREYDAAFLFAESDTETTSIAIWEEEQPALLTLSDLSGATFTPLIPGFNLSTGEELQERGAPLMIPESGSIPIDRAEADDGDYYLYVTVLDLWGNLEVDGQLFSASF